ncbi:hypothetical protein FKW77_000118 [Venturia effusa]|uniref:Uncharacterized protein n=1 Tax=Venturia effusa TaxID=50376 RepID=A0A517L6I3_9PEZI|nr:hypothetical protein FKW77_000118 [Venturia effusa]
MGFPSMPSPYSSGSSRTMTHFNYDTSRDDCSPRLFPPSQRYSLERFPIFYLRISVPPITAVEVFGPFATPAGVIGKFRNYIEARYLGAQSQLDAKFSSEGGTEAFLHFGMTVTDGLTNVLEVQVIREVNRDVKEVIRMQPVWTVVCTEMQHRAAGAPTIKNRQVLRSFPATEAGEREAKGLARSTAEAKLTDGKVPA